MRNRFMMMFVTAALVLSACNGNKQTKKDDSAGEYADAMAKEHDGDEPAPSPAVEEAREDALPTGEEVVYGTVGDEELTGYLVKPKDGGEAGPAVIVIHEWWGLNDNIRTMADRLAAQGYTALAVDLYSDGVAETPERAKELMQQATSDRQAGIENVGAAIDYLQQMGVESLGVVGWCFGGSWSLTTALEHPEAIDATVVYYGHVGDRANPEELAPLDSPLLGIFGAEDQGIPVENVEKFRAALAEAGKMAEIEIYPDAGHAFANPSGKNYVEEAAEDAWEKTINFLGAHLKGQ